MPDQLILFLAAWLGIAMVMALLWVVQRKLNDASSVDVAWALGIGAVTLAACLIGDGDSQRRILLGVLIGGWSLRLGMHLLIDRVIRADEEDGRYRMIREQKGASAHSFLFWFFQAQGIFVMIFSLPAIGLAWDPRPLWTVWDIAAIVIWVISLLGERLADAQLARWRANLDNKGRTCRQGLWRYSRHPNYFFEWLHWWSYPLLGMGWIGSWPAWIVPPALLYLIIFVTGIPYTERQAIASRGDDYRRYQKTTSPFFPWFSKERPS